MQSQLLVLECQGQSVQKQTRVELWSDLDQGLHSQGGPHIVATPKSLLEVIVSQTYRTESHVSPGWHLLQGPSPGPAVPVPSTQFDPS